MVKKFLHTRFRVSNLDSSVKFYTEVFGLEPVSQKQSAVGSTKSARGSRLAFLKAPESEELLELAEYAPSGVIDIAGKDLVHIAFSVDSLEDFGRHLEKIGVKFSEPPAGGIAFVDDPDGYEIELIER